MMPQILIIHGPLMNHIGEAETDLYGMETYDEINASLLAMGAAANVGVDIFQSAIEGELVNAIAEARGKYNFLIINPAAYSHTSVAIHDAVVFCGVPTIEVHLSSLANREPFRNQSTISRVVTGRIEGLGAESYRLALRYAIERLVGHE